MTVTPPGPNAPTEPLITVGSITAVVAGALGAAVAFGLPITDTQQAAVLAVIAVLAPIVVAVWGRAKVFSPATVRSLLATAKRRP